MKSAHKWYNNVIWYMTTSVLYLPLFSAAPAYGRNSNGCIRMPLSDHPNRRCAKHCTLLQSPHHPHPYPQGVPAKVDLVDGQNPAQFDDIVKKYVKKNSTNSQVFIHPSGTGICVSKGNLTNVFHCFGPHLGLTALRDLPGQGWSSLILEAGTPTNKAPSSCCHLLISPSNDCEGNWKHIHNNPNPFACKWAGSGRPCIKSICRKACWQDLAGTWLRSYWSLHN